MIAISKTPIPNPKSKVINRGIAITEDGTKVRVFHFYEQVIPRGTMILLDRAVVYNKENWVVVGCDC